MKLLRGFTDRAAYAGGYVSIGNFDGVHRGHQRMIAALVELARRDGAPAVVLTFDPHPIALLAPGRIPPQLSTVESKAELLDACGVDVLIVYPTDRPLLNLSPAEFFERVVRDELQARGLVEGPNFCFGKDRAGDVGRLQVLCEEAGMSLTIVEAVTEGGRIVSSSAIRAALQAGRLDEALAMLGRPYRLTGVVRPGAGRGQSLGFPTANLTDVATMLPADGVYAARAVLDGDVRPAAVHIGPNPTFAEQHSKLEVHLLDFAGQLYGRSLTIELLARLRATMQFPDAEALKRQLSEDVAVIRRLCGPAA